MEDGLEIVKELNGLTLLDFSFWPYLKPRIYVKLLNDVDELKSRITDELSILNQQFLFGQTVKLEQ